MHSEELGCGTVSRKQPIETEVRMLHTKLLHTFLVAALSFEYID